MANEHSQPSTPASFLWAAAWTIAFPVAVFCVISIVSPSSKTKDERGETRLQIRTKADADAKLALSESKVVDAAKGTAQLSLDSAKSIAEKELALRKPAPSKIKADPMPLAFVPDPKSVDPAPPAMPNAPNGTITVQFPTAPASAPRSASFVTPATPVPATPVPATPVPATPVPATPVPATPVPATPVPATPVPATPVPATPVPATPVPATPVPATPVPATPVPATPVPATPVPAPAAPETVQIPARPALINAVPASSSNPSTAPAQP